LNRFDKRYFRYTTAKYEAAARPVSARCGPSGRSRGPDKPQVLVIGMPAFPEQGVVHYG